MSELTPDQRIERSVAALFALMVTPRIGEITEREKEEYLALKPETQELACALFTCHLDDVLFEHGEPAHEVQGHSYPLTFKMQRAMIWRLQEKDPLLMKMVVEHPASRMFKQLAEAGRL